MMMHGGNSDRGCVEMKVGSQQLFNGCEDRNSVFGRGVGGAGRVRFDGGDQSDRLASGFQLAVDAQVVLAKCAGSGNGNTQSGLAQSGAVHPCGGLSGSSGPCPLTAFRQRP